MALPARSTGFVPDLRSQLPDVKLWVCEDTFCEGSARAKANPVLCPECGGELLLAPLSQQEAVAS